MANSYFQLKQFTVQQSDCAMKVTTDGCLFGAWCAAEIAAENTIGKKALDIGTGTGLLSLMIAQKNNISIDAIEIDEKAAAQAVENFASSPWSDRFTLYQGDIQKHSFKTKYNYIICNPPFYENELTSPNNKRNMAHHSQALELKNLLDVIKNLLKEDGQFFLLLPFKRKTEIEKLLQEKQLFISQIVTVRPVANNNPFRVMIRGSLKPTALKESELIICREQKVYSPAFISLLRDYYLHL